MDVGGHTYSGIESYLSPLRQGYCCIGVVGRIPCYDRGALIFAEVASFRASSWSTHCFVRTATGNMYQTNFHAEVWGVNCSHILVKAAPQPEPAPSSVTVAR